MTSPTTRFIAGLYAVVGGGVAAITGACADAPTGTVEPPTRASASLMIPTPSDAQTVAKGLAFAMRDVSIRKQVHAAMRASRINEHKLVLQEVLPSPIGDKLLTAAAAGLSLSATSLRGAIASLPKLDLYVPFKAHRLTWKPTSDVYVATTFDSHAATITAYGSDGKTVTLERGKVPDVALIILHPAEHKGLRDYPQANTPGDVIQDASDGDVASTFEPAPNSIQGPAPAFLVLPCEGCGGGGGGGGTPIAPGTYINHFNIQGTDDWFGSSEMRFKSFAVVNFQGFVGQDGQFIVSDGLCPTGTYNRDGVDDHVGYEGLFSISPGVRAGQQLTCSIGGISRPAAYGIHILEEDGGLYLTDDDYGWRFYALGVYPFGAMYNTVERYYAATVSSDLTAYVRLEIH